MPLPIEPHRDSTSRAIATIVAVALGGVVGMNAVAAFYLDRYPTNGGYAIVLAKWKLARAAPPADWLVLGDSSCNQGVRPDTLEQQLGGTALNLCTIGLMLAADDAWLLETYLQRAPPPKAIVVVHVYDVWRRNDSRLRKAAWLVTTDAEFWDSQTPALEFSMVESLGLEAARVFPLYFQNESLKMLIEDPRLVVRPRAWHVQSDGFMPERAARPRNVARDAAKHIDGIDDDGPVLSDINRAALQRLCALAAAHDIPMLVAVSPLFEGLYEDPEFRAYYDATLQLVATELNACSGKVELDAAPQLFGATAMANADHLTGDAATDYTQWLSTRIRALIHRP